MTCERMRVALSARLDGENHGLSAHSLDEHLAGCAGCRQWLATAEQLDAALHAGRPAATPDLTQAVLTAVAADQSARVDAAAAAAAARRQMLRVAVAVAAVAQLALAVPVLLSGVGVTGDPHASRELASFDIALAVGFALAAYRPQRARAFVPVAFVLAACLAATSVTDLANASTAMIHEAGHLVAVLQAGLLWALGRVTPRPTVAGPAAHTARPAA